MFKASFRFYLLSIFVGFLVSVSSVWADYCGTDTNLNHVSAGRAETYAYGVYAKAMGSGDELGFHYSDSATLKETSAGIFSKVDSCGGSVGQQPTAPYANASELLANDIVNLQGHYGVAVTGGHLVNSSTGAIPWENKESTAGDINIPAGSTIKYAFLYYSGSIALEGGDFTPDDLGNIEDVENNGITFSVGSNSYGPFDTSSRKPAGETSVGSNTQMLPATVFEYGTLTNTATTFWGSRLDVTGLLQRQTGNFSIQVDAPEQVDISANDSALNDGNPAGNTLYNSCSSLANWSLVVIYENAAQAPQQVILKDEIVRAWDYTFIHKGVWQRPFVNFDHLPMQLGAKFYAYAATGIKAGAKLPAFPTCTCGCGGSYLLEKTPTAGSDDSSQYWSTQLVDPAAVQGDAMNRDSLNGPWTVSYNSADSVNGNDWTLFQSGDKFTEFPNLYEGDNVVADNIQPVTNEDTGVMTGDVYDGHPWLGRGDVTYHGWGNSTSIVEVALDDSAISEGETQTTLYFKGDQKDVFKPQSRVTVRYLLLTLPINDGAPSIDLNAGTIVNYAAGEFYSEAGYTATDSVDGDLTALVAVDCDFDTEVPLQNASNSCTYSVTDTDNNTTSIVRDVIVAEDAAPTIALFGEQEVLYIEGDSYSEAGYSASDDVDGDVTDSVVVDCDFDTPLQQGDYSCIYSVTDSSSNSSYAIRSIVVNPVVVAITNCVTATLSEHEENGRVYESYFSYYTTGAAVYIGSTFINADSEKTLEETPEGDWLEVDSCS